MECIIFSNGTNSDTKDFYIKGNAIDARDFDNFT